MSETTTATSPGFGHPLRYRQRVAALLLAALVVAFRAAAFLAPSRLVAVPAGLALPLNGLGLLFLACGLGAWWVRPSSATRAFLFYGAGMGIHWGGSIAAAGLEIPLLVLYAAATVAGDAAFLELALRVSPATGRPLLAAAPVYGLAAVTALGSPAASHLPERAIELTLGFLFLISFLISLVGAVVWLVKWARASPQQRHERGLSLVIVAMSIAGLANLLGEGGALPGPPQVWGLPLALVPLALARALTRSEPAAPSPEEVAP